MTTEFMECICAECAHEYISPLSNAACPMCYPAMHPPSKPTIPDRPTRGSLHDELQEAEDAPRVDERVWQASARYPDYAENKRLKDETHARMEKKEFGQKFDQGKPRWDLLPCDALDEVAAVLHFGAVKYAARNWEKGMEFGRLQGAAMRHISAWAQGMDDDFESGKSHLAHAACCILMLLALDLRGDGVDDRSGNV